MGKIFRHTRVSWDNYNPQIGVKYYILNSWATLNLCETCLKLLNLNQRNPHLLTLSLHICKFFPQWWHYFPHSYSMIHLNRNERNPYISGCIWVRESFMVSFHSNWNSILVYLLQIFWNHQSMSQTIPFIQRVKLWNEQKNYNLTLPIFLMSSLFICHFKTNKAKNSRRVSS